MAMMQKPPMTAADLPAADRYPAYDVREIMQQGEQARLILDGVTYTLRITRAGKLILTK
jgi:hemin uptake protein HemP